jgi:predicted phosphodiesterase
VIFVGDCHGQFTRLKKMTMEQPNKLYIQLGDFGLGFPGQSTLPTYKDNFRFLRGNHDNPQDCRKHPSYLGDYGGKIIEGKKVFWVAGAFSIDQAYRKEGVTWWQDEEMSILELEEAMEAYIEFQPDIMLSHDGPLPATEQILYRTALSSGNYYPQIVTPTRTGQALSAMFHAYRPKMWIFGHWHINWTNTIEGTEFHCLNELSQYEIGE